MHSFAKQFVVNVCSVVPFQQLPTPEPMPIPPWRLNSSPPQPFVIPEYSEVIAATYGSGKLRYLPSRASTFDPRVLLFVDTEAEVGEIESD